jgi:hypothetical protein
MGVDPKDLQELALQIARLPRAERLQFVNAVLMLGELGDAPEKSESSGRNALSLHPVPVVASCREKIVRVCELAERKGWGHGKLGLLAAVLYVDQQGSWDASFTTPRLDRVIRELNGPDQWEINVQSLHGMERKALLCRRPGTHPIQFCFSAEGYRLAREWAEQPW